MIYVIKVVCLFRFCENMAYKETVIVKINEYQKEELKKFAQKKGMTMSQIIRKAIDEYLLNHE